MSVLRDKLKSLISDIVLPQLSTVKSYSSGTVSSLNDDGSVLAIDSLGNQVTAFPKYPVILGQTVVLVNDGKNNYSAVPVGTKVQPSDIIHPPFFTGGGKFRFMLGGAGAFVNPTAFNPLIWLQDSGSATVYQFTVNYYAPLYECFPSLSQSGLKLGVVGYDSSVPPTSGNFPGNRPQQIAWSTWDVPKTLVAGGSVDPTVPMVATTLTPIASGTIPIPNQQFAGNGNFTISAFNDSLVDDDGNIYILLMQELVANNIVTSANYYVYKNGTQISSFAFNTLTYNPLNNVELFSGPQSVFVASNVGTGHSDILGLTAGITPTIYSGSTLTFESMFTSPLSLWAPFFTGTPSFITMDPVQTLTSWTIDNYLAVLGVTTSDFLGLMIFNGSSGFLLLPGSAPSPFSNAIFTISADSPNTVALGAQKMGISPGKTNPNAPNFTMTLPSNYSFADRGGFALIK